MINVTFDGVKDMITFMDAAREKVSRGKCEVTFVHRRHCKLLRDDPTFSRREAPQECPCRPRGLLSVSEEGDRGGKQEDHQRLVGRPPGVLLASLRSPPQT